MWKTLISFQGWFDLIASSYERKEQSIDGFTCFILCHADNFGRLFFINTIFKLL